MITWGDGSLNSLVMHFSMGLHSTVCFRMKDANANSSESLLHTVTFEGVEHHHAVSDHYTIISNILQHTNNIWTQVTPPLTIVFQVTKEYNFAIPHMHKKCFCECESTERCNAKTHGFTTCPGENVRKMNSRMCSTINQTGGCYRTLLSHQSNTSCANSSQLGSSLCCELSFKPYEVWVFYSQNVFRKK